MYKINFTINSSFLRFFISNCCWVTGSMCRLRWPRKWLVLQIRRHLSPEFFIINFWFFYITNWPSSNHFWPLFSNYFSHPYLISVLPFRFKHHLQVGQWRSSLVCLLILSQNLDPIVLIDAQHCSLLQQWPLFTFHRFWP